MDTNEDHPRIPEQDSTQHLPQAVPGNNITTSETPSQQSTDSDIQHETKVPSQLETEGLPRRSSRIRSQPKWMKDYVSL